MARARDTDTQDTSEGTSTKPAERASSPAEISGQQAGPNGQQAAALSSSAPSEEKEKWTAESHPPRRTSDKTRRSILAGQTIVAVAVILTICYVAKLVLVTLLFSILLAFILFPVMDFLVREASLNRFELDRLEIIGAGQRDPQSGRAAQRRNFNAVSELELI